MKPIVPRAMARADVEAALDYYSMEAGEDVALGFVDAVGDAYRRIAAWPGTGSLRYAYELDMPGLRCLKLTRFPYLVFYVEQRDHVDVWRLLHARRDIPGWMR